MGKRKLFLAVAATGFALIFEGCATGGVTPEAHYFGTGAKRPNVEVVPLEEPRSVFARYTTNVGNSSGVHLNHWPVAARDREVISTFGPRGRRFHNGMDIKAPHSSPVLAVAGGVVTYAGTQRGYGNIIMVDHGDGFMTTYAHLHSKDVEQGDAVMEGQSIGTVGVTGNATTPHVHFEVRHEGKPIDPAKFLPQ